ncbi:MAG: H-NS histone family protein [Roseobacter sp.]|nr:H-NS histone family protein [Roseobacter sp.]
MSFSLDEMSITELKSLKKQVDLAIEHCEVRKRQDALAKIEETAKGLGFSLAELTGRQDAPKTRAKAAIKYRNPNDTSQTWSGRGRQPRWLVAILTTTNAKLEDFEV